MTVPCCYSDVNGTACTCRARKAAETERDIVAREWSEVSQSNYQRAKAAEAEAERNAAISIAAMTRLSEAREAWLAFKDARHTNDHWRAVELLNAALNTPEDEYDGHY